MFVRYLSLVLLFSTAVLSAKTVYLYQKDFDNGTYIIDKPGKYALAEDISFNPNADRRPYHAVKPKPNQLKSNGGIYDDRSYGLGFFAAVVIAADNVVLDFNMNTIEQSKEHALLQRFFAVIELADQPFIPGQGPHNFGGELTPATRTVIKNGTIGRSSHHGIHGNGNRDIRIEGVAFQDFEVAAVALNGVNGLLIKDCTASSREDVPVMGRFSSAQFILPYLDYLVDSGSKTTLRVGGKRLLNARSVRDRLRQAIVNVHKDLIEYQRPTIDKERHPEEYAVFHNPEQVIDGNCYGFLINSYGQAVEGFPVYRDIIPDHVAKNVKFENVHIKRLKGKVNEIIALNEYEKAIVDPVGAVFQIQNLHPDTKEPVTVSSLNQSQAVYTGNIITNAQALVGKAQLNGEFDRSGLDISRSNITQNVIDWIEADPDTPESKLSQLVLRRQDYLCNADSMFHVNKGVVGFKIDGAYRVSLDRTSVKNIVNLSEVGAEMCGMYDKSHSKATLKGCGGPKTRGYSVAGSNTVNITDAQADSIRSLCGSAVGFDIMTDSSNVMLENCEVNVVEAGDHFKHNNGPNEPPMAIGFRVSPDAHNIALAGVCAEDLKGFASTKIVLDESQHCRIHYSCPSKVK